MEDQADVVPATFCESGKTGIGELPRGEKLGVSVHRVSVGPSFVARRCGVGCRPCACADEGGGEEGVDGDKVGGLVEDGVGEGADGEVGADKDGEAAEGEPGSGVGGVDEACAVEKVGVGVAGCGVSDLGRVSRETGRRRRRRRRRTLMARARGRRARRSIAGYGD